MMELLTIAFLTAIGFWIIMVKIGIGKFLRFGAFSDLVITGVITMLFVGTFSGMVTGIIAGIFISIFLSLTKMFSRLFAAEQ